MPTLIEENKSLVQVPVVVSGTVRVNAKRIAPQVAADARAALLNALSFEALAFGQPFALSAIYSVLQDVPGVDGTSLGASLAGQKKYADAEPQLVSGYEGMKRRQDAMTAPDRPALDEAGQSILKLYRDWGKPEKAAEWKQKVQSTSNRDK